MNSLSIKKLTVAIGLFAGAVLSTNAFAGAVFLTGHDPDFHTQPGLGAGANLLLAGISFVTGGTFDDASPAKKFLWVESNIAVPSGHLRGANSLDDIGAVAGVNFDVVDATGLVGVNFSDYSAIAIASSFGGTLTRAELDGLISRKEDIKSFINAGGGLFASAECFPCGANLLSGSTAPELFGYLPISVTSIGANPPFTVTAAGAAAPFNLTNADVNDPTHNSFGVTGGLTILDTDAAGNATTLAGNVRVGDGGFEPVPEPASLALFCLGVVVFSVFRRRKS